MNPVELVGVVHGEVRPWISLIDAVARVRAAASPLEVARFAGVAEPGDALADLVAQLTPDLATLAGAVLREVVAVRVIDVGTAAVWPVAPADMHLAGGMGLAKLADLQPEQLRPFAAALLASDVETLLDPDDLGSSVWIQVQVHLASLEAWLPQFIVVRPHDVEELARLAGAGPSPAVRAGMRCSQRGEQQVAEAAALGLEVLELLADPATCTNQPAPAAGAHRPMRGVVDSHFEHMWATLTQTGGALLPKSLRQFARRYFDDEVYPRLKAAGRYDGERARSADSDREGFYKRFAEQADADGRDWAARLGRSSVEGGTSPQRR